jgi:hypothetical protein
VSGVRNVSALAFQVPGQPAGVFYEVIAFSVQSNEGRQIRLATIEFNLENDTVTELGERLVLTQFEPPERAGDWPAVAFSGTNKVLVAWVHPRDGSADEAHLRRYKLCL